MGFSHKPAPGPVTMARGMECTDRGSLSHSCTPGAGGASAVRNRETNAATVDLLYTGSRRLARPGEASCMVSSLINTQEHWLEEAPDSSVKSVVTKRSVSQLLKTCSSRKKKKKNLISPHHTLASEIHETRASLGLARCLLLSERRTVAYHSG